MKLLILLPFFLFILPLKAQQPVISVLGTIHLHNPGNDKINADVGDITSPQRQAELQAAIDQISQFKPTKIAFEWVTTDTLWSQFYYQAWLEGKLDEVIAEDDKFYLTSELVQLVFPLAKAAGHDRLYPIDAFTSFPLDSAVAYATEHKQTEVLAGFQRVITRGQAYADSIATLPILGILRSCNSRYFSMNLSQSIYLKHILAMGEGPDYPGSFVIEEWYARNIRIFTNLSRVVEPKDRVLVIYGAGHKEILDDLIQDRVDWDWVDGAWLVGRQE